MQRQFEIGAVFQFEFFQPACTDVFIDHVFWHVAPAKARQKKFEPRVQFGEAPDVQADDATPQILAQRRAIGENQLHIVFERVAFQRCFFFRERMIGGHNRHHADHCHGLPFQIVGLRGR